MPINSKQKGNTFELKVAKMLSDWSGEKFHRTPMSGALHWANDTRVISDIVPPQSLVDKGWPFSIECKKTETSWEISAFLDGTSPFWKQWQQCWDDAQREQMKALLVFNKNYRDIYTAMTLEVFNSLDIKIEHTIILQCQGWNLIIMKFGDILQSISCEDLLAKNILKKF